MSSRRGTSALFDAFSHLSSEQTHWNHTLVGWTGEIESLIGQPPPPESLSGVSKTMETSIPLNKASAPIPVDVTTPSFIKQPTDGIWITKDDRERLEQVLSHGKAGKIVPVWLMEEAEGGSGRACLRDQRRWRRYAEHELYTLFHYKQHGPTDGRAERKWWADYYQVNRKFADKVIEIYKPGDIIWIHDSIPE